jgi:hypothetical protein
MSPEVMNQILQTIEDAANSTPSALEFEMAYQARVAIDRIRFAIKHTEQFGPNSDQMRESVLQLLDALQRLETVERRFQARSRNSFGGRFGSVRTGVVRTGGPVNGHAAGPLQPQTTGSANSTPRGENSK